MPKAPTLLRCASFALALPLAAAHAQLTPQQDPANLAGERVSAPDLADTLPINHGAPALQQLLRKLRTRASFLLIVAHPDDEDNGMLTYVSRGKGARVAMLTLNRGEGGQNLMSADFGDALGLIRTQELLAVDRYMDTDQFFGTEVDFGFTKTKEEAFAKWTHERVLYDAVRAIRLYRPLVIASVFIGEPSDGHGQHQVAGEIAQEAFKAAADPTVFPDMGLPPWQPLKVYARSPFARIDAQGMWDYATSQYVAPRFENYVTGKITTTVPKANVIVPEGDTDPLLGGKSYAQFGREARSLQRSQIGGGGSGFAGRGGRADVTYHRYGSMLHQPDGDDSGLESGFFDGIDTSLPAIASLAPEIADKLRPGLEKIDALLAKAQHDFDPAHPEAIAPELHDALGGLDTILKDLENPSVNDLPPTETWNLLHELHIKRVQLNDALALALGLDLKATLSGQPSNQSILTTQKSLRVEAQVTLPSGSDLKLQQVVLHAPGGLSAQAQPGVEPYQISLNTPAGLPATRPYFSRPGIEQPFYNIADPRLRDAPATPTPLTVSATFDDRGVRIDLNAIVADGVDSGLPLPAVVVPPVSVSVAPSVAVVTPKDHTFTVNAQVRTTASTAATGTIAVLLPDRRLADGGPKTFNLQKLDEQANFAFAIPSNTLAGHSVELAATATEGHQDYAEGFRAVGYKGLTPTNYYTPATYRAVPVDVHTAPNLRIAYLPGTGDDVPAGLDQLGLHVHLITVADITPAKLTPYNVVILGVRAYTAHPDLSGAPSQSLIDFARSGGTVIVQYNNGRYNSSDAPFPITTPASSGDHAHDVIDESAPVTILAPDAPALTWPNRITPADFSGWVEERGHSFAGTWAPQYQPLLSCHDPGQAPQNGGLLVAHVGKGFYVYAAYALYRQLSQGVPGAYRLFANLISLDHNPKAARPN